MDQAAVSITSSPDLPATPEAPPATLVPTRDRVTAIDALRGVAVLGILTVNILSFGLPGAAEEDPTVAGGVREADITTYEIVKVVFDGKMRAIFTMLFGAGVVLFTIGKAQEGDSTADLFLRRTAWLAAFGYLHGRFLWEGDILYTYGVLGVVLFLFRKLQPRFLIVLGSLVLLFCVARSVLDAEETHTLREEASALRAKRAARQPLTEEEKEKLDKWRDQKKGSHPDPKDIDKEINNRRGGYLANYNQRTVIQDDPQSRPYSDELLDAAGAMLIGMGLFKLGVFSAARSCRFYWVLLIVGYGVGLPLAAVACWQRIDSRFEPGVANLLQTLAAQPGSLGQLGQFLHRWEHLLQALTYQPSRMAVALGHTAVVMLLVRSRWLEIMVWLFAWVGRMALTNYSDADHPVHDFFLRLRFRQVRLSYTGGAESRRGGRVGVGIAVEWTLASVFLLRACGMAVALADLPAAAAAAPSAARAASRPIRLTGLCKGATCTNVESSRRTSAVTRTAPPWTIR